MTTGSLSAPSPGEPHDLRWLPLLLVPVALLPDLAAALPLRTYFFRDFGAAFYPLHLFAARGLREGRLPDLMREARRFYRLGQGEKLERIARI